MYNLTSSKHKQRGWAWLAWAAPAAAKLAGEVLGQDDQRKAVHEQMDAQREFAQMGIRWKVDDAKAAGIHPLYALGAQTHSYSPVSVGGGGNWLGEMGQDISSAIARQQSQEERREQLAREAFRQAELDKMNRMTWEEDIRLRRQQILGQQLQNDLARQELTRKVINAPTQTGPGFPDNAVPAVGAVQMKPSEQTSRSGIDSSSTAASNPMWDSIEIAPGEHWSLPTQDMDSRMEAFGELWKAILTPYAWYRRNYGQRWDQQYQGALSQLSANAYRRGQARGRYPRRKGM